MNTEVLTHTGDAEFAEIEADINELEGYFGDLGLDDDDQESSSSEFAELDAALAGTEFATGGAESAAPSTFIDLADGAGGAGGEQQELFGLPNPFTYVAKKAAKKAIKWALKRVRKSAKYRKCADKLTSALAAYKRRKYGTALKRAYSAAKCIKAQF